MQAKVLDDPVDSRVSLGQTACRLAANDAGLAVTKRDAPDAPVGELSRKKIGRQPTRLPELRSDAGDRRRRVFADAFVCPRRSKAIVSKKRISFIFYKFLLNIGSESFRI